MAHWRAKLALLIVLVLIAISACWLLLSPHGARSVSDLGTDGSALIGVNTNTAGSSPSALSHADSPSVEIGTPMLNPLEEPDSNPDGPWLISGRVNFAPYQGVDLNRLLSPDDRIVRIDWLDLAAHDSLPNQVFGELGPDGSFSFDVDRLLIEALTCVWTIDFREGRHGDSPLKAVSEASPRPARHDLPGLAQPSIIGRRVDFGLTQFDFATLPKAPLLVTGRLVHTSGLPCTTMEPFMISALKGNSGHYFSALADAFGRFAAFFGNSPEDKEDKKNVTWSFSLGIQHESLPIRAPTIRGHLADLGDTVVNCPLLDVKIITPGVPELVSPVDPCLWCQIKSDLPCVHFWLQVPDVGTSLVLPPCPARVLVPEGRYGYSALLQRPDFHAAPLSGVVAARPGQRTELVLNFEPMPVIPLRVLDPRGAPAPAMVDWVLVPDDGKGDRENGRGRDLTCVPVRDGCVTHVEASSEFHAEVKGTVTPKDREIVLRFAEPRNDPKLHVVMPQVPAASSERIWRVNLCIEYVQTAEMKARDEEADGPESLSVWMAADRKVLHVFDSPRIGPARLWLSDGFWGGYPDGRMTAPVEIVVKGSGVTRVELPQVAPAPWGAPNQTVIAQVLCEGRPVVQEGIFRFGDGASRRYTYTDGQNVTAYVANNMWFGRPPDHTPLATALVATPHDIPLGLRPPQPGRDGELRLDLPACLRLSLTVGGRPADQMTVRLQSYDHESYVCECESSTGRAALWSMPGKAGFRITLPGRGEIHNREVTIKEGECLEFDLIVDDFRVDFTCPVDATAPEAAIWTLHFADTGSNAAPGKTVGWGEYAYLRAGKYMARSDVPHRAEVRFGFEVTRDCEVELPEIEPLPTASLLLRIKESDWRTFYRTEFEYFSSEGRPRPRSAEFEPYDEPLELTARIKADGLYLEGLPLGKRVVVRGFCWTSEGEVLLMPVTLTVGAENTADAKWTRSVRLGEGWRDLKLAVTTDLPGRMLPFDNLFDVRPGKHELAVFLNDKEAFRHTVTVPDKAEPFDVPADLLRKLEEAKERAKPPDE